MDELDLRIRMNSMCKQNELALDELSLKANELFLNLTIELAM